VRVGRFEMVVRRELTELTSVGSWIRTSLCSFVTVPSEDVYIVSEARKRAGSSYGGNVLAAAAVPAEGESQVQTWAAGLVQFPGREPSRKVRKRIGKRRTGNQEDGSSRRQRAIKGAR
jgi:hypothetical protein